MERQRSLYKLRYSSDDDSIFSVALLSASSSSYSSTTPSSAECSSKISCVPCKEQKYESQQPKVVGSLVHSRANLTNLEYSLIEMAEFCCLNICQMANIQATPAFSQFIKGILRATRLPKDTVLLGLSYLRRHMYCHRLPLSYCQLLHYSTVAWMLANKFWDDLTFTNKSWSGVTSIELTYISTMERDWLAFYRWDLNLDPNCDPHWCFFFNQYAYWCWSRRNVQPIPSLSYLGDGTRHMLTPSHNISRRNGTLQRPLIWNKNVCGQICCNHTQTHSTTKPVIAQIQYKQNHLYEYMTTSMEPQLAFTLYRQFSQEKLRPG